jgi:hypothetical protein
VAKKAFAGTSVPPEPILAIFDCADEAAMESLLGEIQKSFNEEIALFQPAAAR